MMVQHLGVRCSAEQQFLWYWTILMMFWSSGNEDIHEATDDEEFVFVPFMNNPPIIYHAYP